MQHIHDRPQDGTQTQHGVQSHHGSHVHGDNSGTGTRDSPARPPVTRIFAKIAWFGIAAAAAFAVFNVASGWFDSFPAPAAPGPATPAQQLAVHADEATTPFPVLGDPDNLLAVLADAGLQLMLTGSYHGTAVPDGTVVHAADAEVFIVARFTSSGVCLTAANFQKVPVAPRPDPSGAACERPDAARHVLGL
jgi:hypothetical protein